MLATYLGTAGEGVSGRPPIACKMPQGVIDIGPAGHDWHLVERSYDTVENVAIIVLANTASLAG